MITKLIFKILFKATLPIVAMVGVVSYGSYLRGGDPAGMFKLVADNTLASAKSAVGGAGDSIRNVGSLGSGSSDSVYKWVDEYGVTQFGSNPPPGVAATAKQYKSQPTVVAAKPVGAGSQNRSIGGLENLPGVAGANLPTSIDAQGLKNYLEALQQPRDIRR